MKKNLIIIGSKSYPNNYGGFEALVESLLKGQKFKTSFEEIFVITEFDNLRFENVQVLALGYRKSSNPVKFYKDSLKLTSSGDIVLILGLGGGFVLWWYRLIKKNTKFVVNLDGLEWRRSKFGLAKRLGLYLSYLGNVLFANRLILDSGALKLYLPFVPRIVKDKIVTVEYTSRYEFLDSTTTNIDRGIVLAVARFVPENNIDLLCEAWEIARKEGVVSKTKEFIFVGDFESWPSDLREKYPNIQFIGPVYDQGVLIKLYNACDIYIHGHSVGGTNPALVEALSFGLNIFAHDNRFNRETLRSNGNYFRCINDLVDLLSGSERVNEEKVMAYYLSRFSNRRITDDYLKVLIE